MSEVIPFPVTPHRPADKTPSFSPGDAGSTPDAATIIVLPVVRVERLIDPWGGLPCDSAPFIEPVAFSAPDADPA